MIRDVSVLGQGNGSLIFTLGHGNILQPVTVFSPAISL
jgi:hypothetical protein